MAHKQQPNKSATQLKYDSLDQNIKIQPSTFEDKKQGKHTQKTNKLSVIQIHPNIDVL